MFRDTSGDIRPIDILKTSVVKIIGINRDFKDVGVADGAKMILEMTQINSKEVAKKQANVQNEMFNILSKIAFKLNNIKDRVKSLENTNNDS